MAFVMMGEKIQIPIGMGWFSVDLNNESIILASNRCFQESYLVVIFFFSGEGDVLIDSIKCVVEESTAFLSMMQNLSSTYHFHTLGGTGVVLMAISLNAITHSQYSHNDRFWATSLLNQIRQLYYAPVVKEVVTESIDSREREGRVSVLAL